MPKIFTSLFESIDSNNRPPANNWLDDGESRCFSDQPANVQQLLNTLSFKVSRKPKDLLAHLKRIYFCYQHHLNDALYTAMIDLAIVLEGKGQALSRRLIATYGPSFDVSQLRQLKKCFVQSNHLSGNGQSLFAHSLHGTGCLVELINQEKAQVDCLTLAHDFIVYSQLDEAIAILEQGFNEQPNRLDIQTELLVLYQSTGSKARFQKYHQQLIVDGISLNEEWGELAEQFLGKTA